MTTSTSPYQNIISNSIISAVCIDDKFVTPYETPQAGDKLEDTKSLYDSFRKEGSCDLDVYKFVGLKKFNDDKKYLLSNKDLLILDWELNDGSLCKYEDALPILSEAIEQNHIQFITIYTHTEDTESIGLKIFSYFKYANHNKEKIIEGLEELRSIEEDFQSDIEIEDIINQNIKGYTLNFDKRRELKYIVTEKIKGELNDNNKFKEFCQTVKQKGKDLLGEFDIFEWLECYCSKSEMEFRGIPYQVEIVPIKDVQFHTFLINNSLISIISKSKDGVVDKNLIKPAELYSVISKIIESIPNKFSALISLELKQFYRKSINAFGRGFMGINEAALIHHAKNYEQRTQYEEFYNFILSCWNSQITYKIKEEIESVKLLAQDISAYSTTPEEKHLMKLNHFLTFSKNTKSVKKRKIRFGDVFCLDKAIQHFEETHGEIKVDEKNYKYLICITQQCDCLRPHKINKNFTFVIGKEVDDINIKSALKQTEKDQYTFVDENKIIHWDKKFLTIDVGNNNEFNPQSGINFQIKRNKKHAIFLGNQKGTFTQRLANLVFSNAMRIGIDLPHL